jgi:autotransporter-associated beta strand protein
MKFHNRNCLYFGRFKNLCVALMAVIAVVGTTGASFAQILGNLDSAGFTYKYEMDVMPSTQDLNTNGVNDFNYAVDSGTITTSSGVADVNLPLAPAPQGNSYLSGGDGTGIWANVITAGEQYTIEFRAKVVQWTPGQLDAGGEAITGAMLVFAAQSSGTSNQRGGTSFYLAGDYVDWGFQPGGNHLLSGIDNMNDYHTYRFVKKLTAANNSGSYQVWRDGVSLGSMARSAGNNLNALFFGGGSSSVTGQTLIDYFRIQEGAYAPAIITWNGSTDTNWAVGGNWDGGVTPTNNVAVLGVDQTQVPPANQPVLSVTELVGGVNFNSGRGGWNISGAGTLTLGSGGIDATNAAHDGTNPITTYVTDTVSVASIVLADDSTWTMGGDDSYRKVTVNSTISGSRNLTVSGGGGSSGILELTGVNTYTGNTTVSAGKLLVNGSLAAGSAVAVNGGVLGGTGTIGGSVTVASGATLSPGTSIESLDVGSLAMSGGKLTFELGAPGSPGVTSDLLNVVNTDGLSITSGTVDLINFGGLAGGTYRLVEYAGTALGDATVDLLTLGLQPAGFTYDLVDNATNLSIDLVVTPAGVPGDFNNDGKVDAADYVLWRKDPTNPAYGYVSDPQDGYNTWRANFGNPPGSGSGLGDGAVPEPTAGVLVAVGVAFCSMGIRRQRRSEML